MPKPKVQPQSATEAFIQPGTVGKKLEIETYHSLRFGYCDNNAQSDFIDNTNGEFNIYIADSFDENGNHRLLIYTNNQLQIIENGIFLNNLDLIAENTINYLDKEKSKALISSSFQNDFEALSKLITDYDSDLYFEANKGEDIEKYKPCYFGLSSTSHEIENCVIDSEIGTILFIENEIPNLSELYGYLDEDIWGTVIGIKD